MIYIKSKDRNRAHNMVHMGRCAAVALASGVIGASVALADSQKPFASKTITMLVGTPAGGGPDATARLTAKYLPKYLPGHPNMIVQNKPGGNQVIASNRSRHHRRTADESLYERTGTQLHPVRQHLVKSRTCWSS
jgi:tripartite-type tricarboxylate transporter receptor subunit TctC